MKDVVCIIIGVLTLSQLCSNCGHQTTTSDIPVKTLRNIRESKYRLTTEEQIAYELNAMMDEYEFFYHTTVPDCEQCSDLEWLLHLEKALDTFDRMERVAIIANPIKSIKSVAYVDTENMARINGYLRKLEAEYENMFKIPVPWWWMCSIEERIMRIEDAIKTNTEFESYDGIKHRQRYKLGKAMAAYELRFKKPFPECRPFEYRRYEQLKQSLKLNLPFLSAQEDTALKNILETEYEKMFGAPISDSELSILRLYFKKVGGDRDYDISVTRNLAGGATVNATAIRQIKPIAATLESELRVDEWLSLVRAFHKLRVHEWCGVMNGPFRTVDDMIVGSRSGCWELHVYVLDTKYRYCVGNIERYIYSDCRNDWPNWKTFNNVVDTLTANIKATAKTVNPN